MMKIKIQKIRCKRCGHHWVPRVSNVRLCPNCFSPYWNRIRTQHPGTKTKPTNKTLIILDIETTGTDILTHSICDLGAVKLNDDLNVYDKFKTPNYIRPFTDSYDPEAMKVHNIPIEKITSNKTPHFKEVSQDFNDWVGDFSSCMLASWGVSFDMTFLETSYNRVRCPWFFGYRYLDIRTLAHWEMNKYNFDDSLSLKEVCSYYNIPFEAHKYHTALGDAEMEARLLKKIVSLTKHNDLFFPNPESTVEVFSYA